MKIYKPRFWDSKKFSVWSYVFFPFSVIFNLFESLFKSKENSSSMQIGTLTIFSSSFSMLSKFIFFIFSFNFSKFITSKSKDMISLLYEGVIFVIPLILFLFKCLK